MTNGLWRSLPYGPLVIGHWTLVIGHWSFLLSMGRGLCQGRQFLLDDAQIGKGDGILGPKQAEGLLQPLLGRNPILHLRIMPAQQGLDVIIVRIQGLRFLEISVSFPVLV